MSYVVRRPGGRFEIRESYSTPRGPRARTLAGFRGLTPAVLDQVEERARGPVDRQALAQRAAELGAPIQGGDARALARGLLVELEAGRTLPPVLAAVLASRLDTRSHGVPDSIPPVIEWMGASAERRGHALRELLRVASLMPAPRRVDMPLAFPALLRRAA